MRVLDIAVAWIRKLLGFLPNAAVEVLWLPVFFVLLVILVRLFLRRGVPLAGRLTEVVMGMVVAALATPVMVILVLVAAPFRELRLSPPNLIFGLDDALVSITTGTLGGLKKATVLAGKASRTHFMVVLILAAAVVWRWDATHCKEPLGSEACARPLVRWAETVGFDREGDMPQPQPTSSSSPQPTPSPSKSKR